MLYLHEAQNLHQLFNAWSDAGKSRSKIHPLSPDLVIVPNMDMAQWIQVQEAERTGISANLHFELPAGFFRKLFEIRDSSVRKQLLDRHLLRWMIFKLLDNAGEWQSLKAWLNVISRNGSTASTHTEARWDLASQITDVYDQYLIYRPDWLVEWSGGTIEGVYTGSKKHAEHFDQIHGLEDINNWQPGLWNEIRNNWPEYPNRADLIINLIQDLKSGHVSAAGLNLQTELTVFGVGSLAPAMVEALVLLSKSIDIHWYVRRNEVPQGDLYSYLHGLNEEQMDSRQVVHGVVEYHGLPIELINHETSGLSDIPQILKKNGSVVIHRCHSARREIEVLHDQLLDLFNTSEIRPGDVAIVCPEPDVYAPFVREVFGAKWADFPRDNSTVTIPLKDDTSGSAHSKDNSTGTYPLKNDFSGTYPPKDDSSPSIAPPPSIPIQISGGKLTNRELVHSVLIQALKLSGSRFKATEILDWLGMAPVLGDFLDQKGLRSTLNRWVDEHMIRWGSTPEHLSDLGFEMDGRHTWRHGLDRLILAYTSSENQDFVYHDMISGAAVLSSVETELLGNILRLTDVLEQIRSSGREEFTLPQWCERLENWLQDIISDREWIPYCDRLQQTIQTLKSSDAQLFSEVIPFSVFLNEIEERLSTGGIGRTWSPGEITFTGMVALHQFPYKVVAMVGLNDGALPGRTPISTFDIISQNYRPGDRIRRRGDRQLFLDYLYCVTEKLLISFTGNRQIDQKTLAPSVMVTTLYDFMERLSRHEQGYIPQEFQHRMQPFHSTYFSPVSDIRSYSAHYAGVARKLQKNTEKSEPILPVLTPAVAAVRLKTGDDMLNISTLFPDGIPIKDLIEFYKKPFKYVLRDIHGIDLYDEEVPDEDFEPFELDKLTSWAIRNDLLELFHSEIQSGNHDRWMRDRESLIETLKQRYKRNGWLPDGVAGVHGFEKSIQEFHTYWSDFAQKVPDIEKMHPHTQKINLHISEVNLTLHGEVDAGYLISSDDITENVFLSAGSSKGSRFFLYWVHHVLCNLEDDVQTRVFFRDKELKFRPLSREEAEVRVQNLVVMMVMSVANLVPVIVDFAEQMYDKNELSSESVQKGMHKVFDISSDVGEKPHASEVEKVLQDVWVRHAWKDTHPLEFARKAIDHQLFYGMLDRSSNDEGATATSISISDPADLRLRLEEFAKYDAFSLFLVKVVDLMKGDFA